MNRQLSAVFAFLLFAVILLFGHRSTAQNLAVVEMTLPEIQRSSKRNDISVDAITNASQFRTLTTLNCRAGIGISSELVTVLPTNTIVDNKAEVQRQNSEVVSIRNLGANANGLWLMVAQNDRPCFVRASSYYLTADLTPPSLHSYVPPQLSQPLLGNIPIGQATPLDERFNGLRQVLRLPGGQIYIDADMSIDADGSPRAPQIDPPYGQLETSMSIGGRPVNAEVIPYFVLPGNNSDVQQRFFRRMGIQLGDIAAVIYHDRIEYAIFADVGPTDKIGEGSIALAQSLLGRSPVDTTSLSVQQMRQITCCGIPEDVIYIIFPNSRLDGLTPTNTVERVRARGQELFSQLGGNLR